jgi:hypothetical protein
MNFFFPKGGWIFLADEKLSSLSTPLYITQFINTYIDPVCPDRLTLRYCSCNTYLLHRRAELKAAPRSKCLTRNWTIGNNEPLAVPTGISGVTSCFVLNERNNWPLIYLADYFVLRILAGLTPVPVWTVAENFAPTWLWFADGPAHRQSLYRLSSSEYSLPTSMFAIVAQ